MLFQLDLNGIASFVNCDMKVLLLKKIVWHHGHLHHKSEPTFSSMVDLFGAFTLNPHNI